MDATGEGGRGRGGEHLQQGFVFFTFFLDRMSDVFTASSCLFPFAYLNIDTKRLEVMMTMLMLLMMGIIMMIIPIIIIILIMIAISIATTVGVVNSKKWKE